MKKTERKTMKILVIDDKAANREAAVSMLSEEHEVTTVGSYDEAMNLIEESVGDDDVLRALGRPIGPSHPFHIDDEFLAKAAELRPKFNFDIVLLDLMMPVGRHGGTLGRDHHAYKEEMPYGFPLMVSIAMRHSQRVTNIAIVSDVNHHHHAMSAALDPLGGDEGGYVKINGVRCSFIHARLLEDGSKNWGNALKKVLSPKDC